MKCRYYPDMDYLVIQIADGVEDTTANVTHMALASLDEHNRILSISLDKASRQFRNTDLATAIPEVAWRVPEHDINVRLAGGPSDGAAPTDKIELSYYLDSDMLHLGFANGPVDIVVDITNSDIGNVDTDGTLMGVTISWAQELLQIEDATTYIPEFQWTVHERKRTPAIAT